MTGFLDLQQNNKNLLLEDGVFKKNPSELRTKNGFDFSIERKFVSYSKINIIHSMLRGTLQAETSVCLLDRGGGGSVWIVLSF